MTTVDSELRQALQDLAERGQPVNLGQAAVAGARRRQRIRFGVAGAGLAAAVAIALPLTLTGGAGTEEVPSAGAEQVVITYYLAGDPFTGYALDPDTGEYHRDAEPPSSPDLRHTIKSNGNFVVNLADRSRQRIPWPEPVHQVSWSPDGTHLAGGVEDQPAYTPSHPEEPYPISSMQVADLGADTGWTIPLELPAHHAGTDVFWLDQQRLAVPVTDLLKQPVEVPPRYEWREGNATGSDGGGAYRVASEIQIYALDGALTARLPVDQSDFTASGDVSQLWHVSGVPSDGRVVLMRHPDESTLELATVDTAGLHPRAVVTLPDAPEGHYWDQPSVVLGLAGGQVLVAAEQHFEPGDSGPSVRHVTTAHYVVDLTTGQTRPSRVPTLPDGGRPLLYADASALAPTAAHRAFTP